MDAVEYLTRLALLGVVVASFWLSAGSLRRWLVPAWQGAPAALASIVLALSALVITSEILGLLGLLNTPALVIAALGLTAGLHRWRPGRANAAVPPALRHAAAPPGLPSAGTPPAPPSSRVLFALAIAAAIVTAIHWAGPALQSLDVGIYRQDSTWYHLPFAAWFAQTGSVGGLLLTDPLKLTVWYYPLNSELLHAVGMVVLDNDLLSPLLNFGWMGLTLLAAWCIGRPFGLAAATLLGAVLVVDSDMMLVQAGNAPSDIVALACLMAAIAVLVNGWAARALGSGENFTATGGPNRTATAWLAMRSSTAGLAIDPGPLAIAALAAGLAVGTKVTMLAPVGVITLAILVSERPELRRRAAIWLGGLLAGGGFWYLRNLAHAGNPLPWINFGPLPGPEQEALYPRPAHSIAEYLADRHAWTEFFLPGLGEALGPLWFLVLFASLAGILLGLRRRHGALIRTLALAAAATLIAHVFVPISASGPEGGPYGFASNLRYAAPGLAIGLVLLPLCESRAMARRVLVPAYALLAAVAAIASLEWVQPQPLVAIAIGTVAVLAPVGLLRGSLAMGGRLAIAALATLALLGGYLQQHRYFEDRYRADVAPPLDNPGFRATPQWRLIQTWAREQRGLRIGIVGTPAAYGQYVFYGEDLSNEVRYLGEPQPHGGLTTIASCRRWRERVHAGGFDAIVITPEDPASPFLPPQIAWTDADGAAQAVLRIPPAAVFFLAGPLDPDRCRAEMGPESVSPGLPAYPYLHPGGGGSG